MTYFWNSNSCNPSLIQKILFELKLLSQGSIEQDHLSNNVKKLGLTKRSVSVMNQSKKQQLMTCYLALQFIIFIWSPFCTQAKNYVKLNWIKLNSDQSLHFLGGSGLNRVWRRLPEVVSSYVGDSVEVLSVLTIIAKSGKM